MPGSFLVKGKTRSSRVVGFSGLSVGYRRFQGVLDPCHPCHPSLEATSARQQSRLAKLPQRGANLHLEVFLCRKNVHGVTTSSPSSLKLSIGRVCSLGSPAHLFQKGEYGEHSLPSYSSSESKSIPKSIPLFGIVWIVRMQGLTMPKRVTMPRCRMLSWKLSSGM